MEAHVQGVTERPDELKIDKSGHKPYEKKSRPVLFRYDKELPISFTRV